MLYAITAAIACNTSSATECSTGVFCPAGLVCNADGDGCIDPFATEACDGLDEEAACTTAQGDGFCRFGECVVAGCGNGFVEPSEDEECDCGAEVAVSGCAMPNSDAPEAVCKANCKLQCGDGVRNIIEECDGRDVGPANCVELGFDVGYVSCTSACQFDSTTCQSYGFVDESPIAVAVSGFSETDVYVAAVDVATKIGPFWVNADSGLGGVNAVVAAGPDDVWAVGEGRGAGTGYVARLEDGLWTEIPCGVAGGMPECDEPASSVTRAGGSIFVGSKDAVHAFDGTSWTAIGGGGGPTVLWGPSETDVYAINKDGVLEVYDGQGWSPSSDTTVNPVDVWGRASNDVYVAGDTLSHYDGIDWTTVPLSADNDPFVSVTGNANSVVAFVDNGFDTGLMAHWFDGATWVTFDAPLVSRSWMTPSGRVFVARAGSPLQRFDGTGVRSFPSVVGLHADIDAASEQEAVAVQGSGGVLFFDGQSWAPLSGLPPAPTRCAYAAGSGDYVLAGLMNGDTVITTVTGDTPTNETPPAGNGFTPIAIDGGGGLVVVVGTLGSGGFASRAALTKVGSGPWTLFDFGVAPLAGDLTDVWVDDNADVAIGVGGGGTVVRYSGGTWEMLTPVQAVPPLTSVWGTDPSNVYMASSNGGIYRFDGAVYERLDASAGGLTLRRIRGTGPNDILATSAIGWLHFDGVRWRRARPFALHPLVAVAGRFVFTAGQGLAQLVRVRPWAPQ